MPGWRVVRKRKEIPASPGCYALYTEEGGLVYIGSATNLKKRLGNHLRRPRPFYHTAYDQWIHGECPYVEAKIKVSRRLGDWLMWEFRLITRLQPKENRAGVQWGLPPKKGR